MSIKLKQILWLLFFCIFKAYAGVDASHLCNDIENTYEKKTCYIHTAKQNFDPVAVEICAGFGRHEINLRNKCLQITSGEIFNPRALNICKNSKHKKLQLKCLKIIRGQRFDEKIFPICENHKFDYYKNVCLDISAGILYKNSALYCATTLKGEVTMNCLVDYGANINKLPLMIRLLREQ